MGLPVLFEKEKQSKDTKLLKRKINVIVIWEEVSFKCTNSTQNMFYQEEGNWNIGRNSGKPSLVIGQLPRGYRFLDN